MRRFRRFPTYEQLRVRRSRKFHVPIASVGADQLGLRHARQPRSAAPTATGSGDPIHESNARDKSNCNGSTACCNAVPQEVDK